MQSITRVSLQVLASALVVALVGCASTPRYGRTTGSLRGEPRASSAARKPGAKPVQRPHQASLIPVPFAVGDDAGPGRLEPAEPDRGATVGRVFEGEASYYGSEFHGRRTASGERFNRHALTAAHRTLSFGTRVRVTNIRNGKSVVVRVNDRGPHKRGRVVDLSYEAARRIGMVATGVARVRVEVLDE